MTVTLDTDGLAQYRLYVGGEESDAADGGTFESIDPTTGEPWARIAAATAADVDRAVAVAAACFEGNDWTHLSATRRGRLLMRLADAIAENAEQIAEIETRDNGKLLSEMTMQLRAVPDYFYYFGGLADKIEGRVIPLDRPNTFNYTLREPLGVVGIITPWNSPVLLTTLSLAPALAAGNVVVLKPSEVTSASIVEVARLAETVGFPPGAINVVTGGGEVGKALAENARVAKVCFSGGTATGRRIAEGVGRRLGRIMLELGGKSPNIVFADADVVAAEAGLLAGIFAAGGQSCVAGARALIQEEMLEEITDRLRRRAEAIVIGDPMKPTTQMGPIATRRHLESIAARVQEAVGDGAQIISGGAFAEVPDHPRGFFYRPTVIAGVANSAPIAREEVFGPVLTILPFSDEEHAIEIANDTAYGLAAGIWTRDVKRAHRVARALEAGTVWINLYRGMTFNSPFGGYKQSGIGRENGMEAIDEFLQTKSVWCELGEGIQDPFTFQA